MIGCFRSHVTGVRLTRVDLLQSDVFLQLPAEADLGSVLPAGPVIGQDEVGVAAVQD